MTDQWCKPARTTAKNIVTSTRWHLCRLSKLQFWLTTFYKLGGWICCLDMYNIYKSSLMKLFTYLVFNKAKWLLKTRQKFSGSIKPWNFSPDLRAWLLRLLPSFMNITFKFILPWYFYLFQNIRFEPGTSFWRRSWVKSSQRRPSPWKLPAPWWSPSPRASAPSPWWRRCATTSSALQ